MKASNRQWRRVVLLQLITAVSLVWLLLWSMQTRAATPAAPFLPAPLPHPASQPAPPSRPLGGACGHGEKLPPTVICLFGVVVDASGAPLNGAQVRVTANGRTLTTTTFIHPDSTTPGYSLDLSALGLRFLQAITVTTRASSGAIQAERRVLAYPDFTDQTQRLDLRLPAATGLSPSLCASDEVCGQVSTYADRLPVAAATIRVQSPGIQAGAVLLTMTTSANGFQPSDPTPGFHFAPGALGISPGSLISLTVEYNGDQDQRAVIWDGQPQEVNFITGWQCDQGSIPKGGGAFGLPPGGGKGGGAFGLPDLACLWGIGALNSIPTAGMEVRLAVRGSVYSGETQLFSGATEPRFGILVPASLLVTNTQIVAALSYRGVAVSQPFTARLDATQSQQLNLNLTSAKAVDADGNRNYISTIAYQEWQGHRYVWVGTAYAGLLRWDLTAQPVTYTQYTNLDGLRSNYVASIVVDQSQRVWVAHGHSDLSLYDPNTEQWRIIGFADSSGIGQLSIDNCDHLWASGRDGIVQIENVGTETSPDFRLLSAFDQNTGNPMVEPDCDIWFVYSSEDNHPKLGFRPYNPSTKQYAETWQDISVPELISGTHLPRLLDPKGYFWFSSVPSSRRINTVLRFKIANTQPPSLSEPKTYTIPTGMPDQVVGLRHLDAYGRLWAVSLAGASYLVPTQEQWSLLSSAQGLPYKRATAVASDPWNGDIWIGTPRGLSQHDRTTLQQKNVYIARPPIQFYDAEGVMVAVDDIFGGLLIGTKSGAAYYYSPTLQTWQAFTTTVDFETGGLSAYHSIDQPCITVDKLRGDVWFCDFGGVNHWNPTASQPFTRTMVIDDGSGGASVTKILVVGDHLWVSTLEHGVYVYDIQSHSLIISYTTANATWLPGNNVYNMEQIGSDIWFGTEEGVSMYNPTTGATKTLTLNSPGSQFSFRDVMALGVGKDGLLWFGGGVCIDGNCSHYSAISNPYDTLNDRWVSLPGLPIIEKMSVNDIFIADDNSPWFGVTSPAWGLGHYNRQTQSFARFSEQDGLPGSHVYGISSQKGGGLLLAAEGLGRWEIAKPQSDLALRLQAPSTMVVDKSAVYTLTVTNQGDGDATNALLTLTLPPTVTFANATPAPVTTQPLHWQWPTITAGSAITLVINATVLPNAREGTRLVASATVTATSPDAFLPNNHAQTVARVRNGVDVGVSLIGPPVVDVGQSVSFTAIAENIGGSHADDVVITASDGKNCTMKRMQPGQHMTCILADQQASAAGPLNANVQVSTSSTEQDVTNNRASATVEVLPVPAPGSPAPQPPKKSTLILVAPARLPGASQVMPLLTQLAQHPNVAGLVVDVTANPVVSATYKSWDAAPNSPAAANQVVSATKQLVEKYRQQFPDLHYLVIVGGDPVIPFYRVSDGVSGPEALWQERKYALHVPAHDRAVRAAFDDNLMLTDDFLAAPAGGITVHSNLWPSRQQKTYVPELAVGRLVEHAEEIAATLQTFLSGQPRFNPAAAAVFAEPGLTDDLGEQQCLTLGRDRSCVQGPDRLALSTTLSSLLLNAVHSNHRSTGAIDLQATDEFAARFRQIFATPFVITIGCHTGLNLADELDLVEAILSLGGTIIGPNTYAYAAEEQIAYSEALADVLTRLLRSGLPPGDALLQAKRQYFTTRAGNATTLGWFDPLDEKVLLPLTLYGLPMSNGHEQSQSAAPVASAASPSVFTVGTGSLISATFSLSALDYISHPAGSAQYYQLTTGQRNGVSLTESEKAQFIVQAGQPLQPALSLPLTDFTTPTVLLRSATYREEPGVSVKLAQAKAISERKQQMLPQIQGSNPVTWDHNLPYAVSVLLTAQQQQPEAKLNLALGAFNTPERTERLFSELTLHVLQGDGNHRLSPADIQTGDFSAPGQPATTLQARVSHLASAQQIFGVCDIPNHDHTGRYVAVELGWQPASQLWQGVCPGKAERFYVQVIDTGHNTTSTPWLLPTEQPLPPLSPPELLYFPMITANAAVAEQQQQPSNPQQDQ